MASKYIAPVSPPKLDFIKLCRDSESWRTLITVYLDYERFEWMRLGQIRLQKRSDHAHAEIWDMFAYLQNATDFEHDSALVFKMELVGVAFDGFDYGRTRFSGWIKGDPDSFRVPNQDYNPLEHPKATRCKMKECANPHLIVPEGCYIPLPNPEMLSLVVGRRVEVVTGPKDRFTF